VEELEDLAEVALHPAQMVLALEELQLLDRVTQAVVDIDLLMPLFLVVLALAAAVVLVHLREMAL
jgi:hypothetical protein